MFIIKQEYFIIIKSINDIQIDKLKKYHKFSIIYRTSKLNENFNELIYFRRKCKVRKIKFFVANNIKLASLLKSDGIYISSSNKSFRPLNLNKSLFTIIGSAHNFKEIHLKIKQGCKFIIVSKLFKVDYDPEAKFMGMVKFNNLINLNKNIIPLGGIKCSNLNKLRLVKSFGIAIMSEIKKKPTISSRLF